jgi:23S rRNA pseudouridine2605 synthase
MKPPRPSAALVRVLSKRGFCSRAQAFEFVHAGRVRVNGKVARDPLAAVPSGATITVDNAAAPATSSTYIMLNKPRGLVTTTSDERGRDTVYSCLAGSTLPRLITVGRLDKASEGLLLLTNDNAWAAKITDPASPIDKTYDVQIGTVADHLLLDALTRGVRSDGEHLRARSAKLLRGGEKNSWIQVVLDEGRNRHIRRMLDSLAIEVLRLVRVSIGPLTLGTLAKGQWRHLTTQEVRVISPAR